MAEMKKYNKMKNILVGGTITALLGVSLFSYSTLDSQNTQVVKDRTMSIASGLVDTVKYKEFDIDKVTDTTWGGAVESGNNYAYMLGSKWKANFASLTNDALLVLAKDYGFSDITVYNIGKDAVSGVLSTQPKNIEDKLVATDEEKEILNFLLQTKSGEKGTFSNTLQTYKTSISSGLYTSEKVVYTTVYTYVPELDKVIALGVPLTDYTYFEGSNNTNKLIDTLKAENPLIVEIGVLDVSNFTPKKEEVDILSGTFKYSATTDNSFLSKIGEGKTTSTYVQQVGEKQLFKHFEVIDENRVVYVGLDFSALLGNKPNTHITIFALSLLALAIVGVLQAMHFRKEKAYHQRLLKRLTSLTKGKYDLKALDLDNDEYRIILDHLNELTDELSSRKKTSKETLKRLSVVISVLTNGEIKTTEDLNELRYELKSILHDIQVILKIED